MGLLPCLGMPHPNALRPVIPINAPTLRITAAAVTELAGASFAGTVNYTLISTHKFLP